MKKLSAVILILLTILLAMPSGQEVRGQLGQAQNKGEQINETSKTVNIDAQEIKEDGQDMQEEIAKKIIRFHVIANSDSDEDQKLKLKVRDEVLKFIAPKLKVSKSIDESRNIIIENNENMINLAEKIIKENGYDYSVKTTLGQCNFPVKEYGNIVLPEGQYEAYRIVIGDGEGKNWWCVMFPPLCFVDITKGQVAYDETKDEMKTVLNDQEYDYIDKEKDANSETVGDKKNEGAQTANNDATSTETVNQNNKSSESAEVQNNDSGSTKGTNVENEASEAAVVVSDENVDSDNKEAETKGEQGSASNTNSGEIQVKFKIVEVLDDILN